MVSDSSKRMAILNEYDTAEFGRRIDILLHQTEYGQDVEFCSIEFKTQSANDTLLHNQQSKNIRINATMLNDIIQTTKDKNMSSVYMDWWGTSRYLIHLFKQENYFIAQHIAFLHIPSSLLELDDFKSTLIYLYKWRSHLLDISKTVRTSLFQNKRKYETMDISSSNQVVVTPDRSISLLSVDIFYTPSSKRVKSTSQV